MASPILVTIRVKYSTLDRFTQTRSFKTLAGARKFAQKYVGAKPEISDTFGYAVSGDGMGKIIAQGCSIHDLFPENT